MAPADVWLSIEGYNERNIHLWELERMTWFYIHAHSMMDGKHKKKSPQALHPFGWEKKSNAAKLSPQEILEHHRKMKAERKLKNAGRTGTSS